MKILPINNICQQDCENCENNCSNEKKGIQSYRVGNTKYCSDGKVCDNSGRMKSKERKKNWKCGMGPLKGKNSK